MSINPPTFSVELSVSVGKLAKTVSQQVIVCRFKIEICSFPEQWKEAS